MIVQPTAENMGFNSIFVDARIILERLFYVFLGGLITSGLFLFVQEIPNPVFVFLMAVAMMLVNIYANMDGDDK